MGSRRTAENAALSLLAPRPRPGYVVRTVVVDPGRSRPHRDAEWRGALVVVERGTIELVGLAGTRRRIGPGGVLWLAGLGLRALHNRGPEPAVLSAVTRVRTRCQDCRPRTSAARCRARPGGTGA